MKKHQCSASREQSATAVALKNILVERSDEIPTFRLFNEKGHVMKLTAIALAIAFTLPTTFAVAASGMNFGNSSLARPFSGVTVGRGITTGATSRIATRPPNLSGNTLAPIMHDPSGSTLTPAAMNRGA
jgi:hypothetical protein